MLHNAPAPMGGKGCGIAMQTPACWGYTAEHIRRHESCLLRKPAAIERSTPEPALSLEELSLGLENLGMKRLGFVSLCCLFSLCVAQRHAVLHKLPGMCLPKPLEQVNSKHRQRENSISSGTHPQPDAMASAVEECLEQPIQMDVLNHDDLQLPSGHHLVPWGALNMSFDVGLEAKVSCDLMEAESVPWSWEECKAQPA